MIIQFEHVWEHILNQPGGMFLVETHCGLTGSTGSGQGPGLGPRARTPTQAENLLTSRLLAKPPCGEAALAPDWVIAFVAILVALAAKE